MKTTEVFELNENDLILESSISKIGELVVIEFTRRVCLFMTPSG